MILDDKLIEISNIIIQTLKTDLLMFQYQSNRVVISSLNRSYTVLLKIIIDKKYFTEFPETPSIYLLPVDGHHYWDSEGDIKLNLNEYHQFNQGVLHEKRRVESLTKLNRKLTCSKGFNWFPVSVLMDMMDMSHHFRDSIDFRYKKYTNTISSNLLKEAFVNDVRDDAVYFKLYNTDCPLFLQYDTVFEDPCVCNSYIIAHVCGVVASKIESSSELMIRIG